MKIILTIRTPQAGVSVSGSTVKDRVEGLVV